MSLETLLDSAMANPRDRKRIEQEITDAFGCDGALLVLDMVGVARLAQRRGIAAFLMAVHQVRRLVAPVVSDLGGTLLEAKADDIVSLFDDVPDAIGAANEILRLLKVTPELPGVSIGVGYGSLLRFDDDRIAGLQLNLASKLGEDLARPGEILLTPEAHARLSGSVHTFAERRVRVSGIELTHYALQA